MGGSDKHHFQAWPIKTAFMLPHTLAVSLIPSLLAEFGNPMENSEDLKEGGTTRQKEPGSANDHA